mgnify:CR=1 FL=1|tara:strand:- start:7043 stop:8074 length:1032 start_codon:yes stop_codon:yes gene_type:complete
MNIKVLATAAVLLLVFLVYPYLMPSVFYVSLASQIFIASIMALSLNLLVGYGGMVSLGHAAYPGVAAYLVIWLSTRAEMDPLSVVLVTMGAVTLMAGLFGLLALRAKGLSFLMITLALGQIVWGVAYRWVGVTGGDNGLSGLGRPAPFGIDLASGGAFYYFAGLCFAFAMFAMYLFVRSPFGASLKGVRDQPARMAALGYNVWMIRYISFIISGFWGGISGVLYAYYHQFISPHAISIANSAEFLLMVIAGGAGTLLGPVVGATLVMVLKNVVSAYVTRWLMLLGIIFVIIVIFLPEGLVPGVGRLRRRLKEIYKTPGGLSAQRAALSKSALKSLGIRQGDKP